MADRARLRAAVDVASARAGRASTVVDLGLVAPDPGSDTPAVRLASARFGLGAFERDVLALALAVEVDADLAAGVARLTGADRGVLRLRAAIEVLGPWLGDARDQALLALAPGAPLIGHLLVEVVGAEPLLERRLRLPDPVLARLLGREAPTQVAPLAGPPLDALALAPTTRARVDELVAWARSAPPGRVAIGVRGRPGSGRDTLAAAVAAALGFAAVRCRHELVDPRDVAAAVRDATWAGAALVTTGWAGADAVDARRTTPRLAVLDRLDPRRDGAVELDLDDLDPATRGELWRARLGETLVDIDRVAAGYRFGAGRVARVAGAAAARAAVAGRDVTLDDVRWAARDRAASLVERRAERLEVTVTADDLVVPPRTLRELELIRAWSRRRLATAADPVRARDLDRLACLFWGPPGTGKSMAAQILARESGLDVWRVDLAQVVNKYIGETEKNLDRVFDDAADAGAVLIFDEADALFGKRTETKDAHDRYANQETAYLLQRLETHPGLVILTTNLAGNLDNAFVRRLFISAEFPAPEAAERLAIWRRHVRGVGLAADVELGFLADRFALAGGDIRNAASAARLLAGAGEAPVAMVHLAIGACRELMRTGRLTTSSEFGAWADEVAAWINHGQLPSPHRA